MPVVHGASVSIEQSCPYSSQTFLAVGGEAPGNELTYRMFRPMEGEPDLTWWTIMFWMAGRQTWGRFRQSCRYQERAGVWDNAREDVLILHDPADVNETHCSLFCHRNIGIIGRMIHQMADGHYRVINLENTFV